MSGLDFEVFEIGDRVLIRNNLEELDDLLETHYRNRVGIMPAMRLNQGREATIKHKMKSSSGVIHYEIDLDTFIYSGLFFRRITDENKNYLLNL